MFTPFIGYNDLEKNYILLGKHRLYSLKYYTTNLNKKFLFIDLNTIKQWPINLKSLNN